MLKETNMRLELEIKDLQREIGFVGRPLSLVALDSSVVVNLSEVVKDSRHSWKGASESIHTTG